MRRLLSILLLIALGLGPTIAAVPANAFAGGIEAGLRAGFNGEPNESQLPACCRRNGKHHCALSNQSSSTLGAHRETSLSSNESCPFAPQALDSTAPSLAAILLIVALITVLLTTFHPLQTIPAQARLSDRRSQPMRGPPAMQFA